MRSSRKTVPPFAATTMTKFLSRRLDELKGEKTYAQVARELDYPHSNIISMFKSGETKVPLEKIPALAKALDVDVAHLLRLGLEQHWPGKMGVITEIFGRIVTDNELALIMEIRERTKNADPKITISNVRHSPEFLA